jgi:hypothetical protein
LVSDSAAFWFRAYMFVWVACTVCFAECMTTSHKRDRLFIIHRHTGKCVTDVAC